MESDKAPEEILKFFSDRSALQTFRRKLREENLLAKESYSSKQWLYYLNDTL